MLFRIKNLEFNVQEKNNLIDKLNFDLKKHNHLLILGPSGCGKTTLMNIMSGLLKASSGTIEFEGNDYSSLSSEEIDELRAKSFGFIFQKLHLIKHLNVLQNIMLAKNKKKSQNIYKLIDELGLTNKKNQMVRDLSFGEAQRVAIARGLANNPKVIFADEPTSGLDDENTNKVMSLLFSEIKKNHSTLIVCTHDNRIKKFFSNTLEI